MSVPSKCPACALSTCGCHYYYYILSSMFSDEQSQLMRHVEIFQTSEKKREASERQRFGEEETCQGLCYPDGILQSAVNPEHSLDPGLST